VLWKVTYEMPKTKKASEFNINPFTATYLANFLTGDASPESIAKALIYPRILGTSINTTFGGQFKILRMTY